MKKIMMLMAVLAMVGSNSAFAQNNSDSSDRNMGRGSSVSTNAACCNNYMGWLVGLGSLAVLGTVVGLSASSGASDPSSFGH